MRDICSENCTTDCVGLFGFENLWKILHLKKYIRCIKLQAYAATNIWKASRIDRRVDVFVSMTAIKPDGAALSLVGFDITWMLTFVVVWRAVQ